MSIISNESENTKVYDHILEQKVGYLANWAWKTKDDRDPRFDYGGCHSKAMVLCHVDTFHKHMYFASTAAYPRQSYSNPLMVSLEIPTTPKPIPDLADNVQEYLEWLYTEDSPWWNLHKGDIEIIRDANNDIRGFIAGPSVFNKKNRTYFFNFLIANRMTRDHASQFRNFKDLKGIGLTNFQAYVLSPYLKADQTSGQWVKYSTWNASHTPLREAIVENFWNPDGYQNPIEKHKFVKILDLERFRRGEFDTGANPSLSSYGWLSPAKNGERPLSVEFETAVSVKTRFSKVNAITNEKILEYASTIPQ